VKVVIDPGGTARCLYAEAIDLAALGRLTLARASHVEPDGEGQWWAELSPVAGPKLGPYALRSEALSAEAAWLEEHRLSPGRPPAAAGPAPP
jgi:hypothetical protein